MLTPYLKQTRQLGMRKYNVSAIVWLLFAGFLVALSAGAQAPPNGTTVYRCIDLNGVVSFADAPCTKSVSHRMRIEHSLIQSVPISIEEQQRLYALEARLNGDRSDKKARKKVSTQKRLAQAEAAALRCKQARMGLTQIRSRKKRGYPIGQSTRIDNEQVALEGEIKTYCDY